MNKVNESDLLIIGKICLKDTAIISLFNFYEWQLNNANKERSDIYNQNFKYLDKPYNEIIKNIENKLNELKDMIVLYAIFAIENKYVEIKMAHNS